MKLLWMAFWLIMSLLIPLPGFQSADDGSQVLLLTADGPVTPVMVEYLERGLRTAERDGAEALIFRLNTPGGSVTLMNEMVQALLDSRVPAIVYVSPRGAMAASAGTLITLAGHAAAMAPETIIGAASPVGGQGEDLGETAAAKEKSALKATARSLAERRGPQAVALAEATIETAEAVSASEALEVGLVDFIAADEEELLAKLDGFQVETAAGPQTLQTAGAEVVPLELSFLERLLAALTNPNVVFLLLNIGVFALIIELSSPGGWLAGFIGVVCLLLAMYALGVLPVNWFGLLFLATAFVLFVLDIKAPTHGGLTAAGVASLIAGALILFNSSDTPGVTEVSVPLVISSSLFTGAMFSLFLIFALRAQKIPVRMGQESMVGRTGIARTGLAPTGIVRIGGENWTARLCEGHPPLTKGERIEVVQIDGLKLIVRGADR
jgi:membrane-bound serine protease (ClpP class)